MTNKIFRNTFLVCIISVVLSAVLIIAVLYGVFDASLRQRLGDEAQYISKALNALPGAQAYLESIDTGANRITLIMANGDVLFDSQTAPALMDNHLQRPEIQLALTQGVGSSSRYSATLSEQTIYSAVLLQDGSVLRLSNTRSSIFGTLYSMISMFTLILVGVAIFAAVLSRRLSRQIVRPINDLDLEHPLANDSYPEISPLLLRIERQRERIRGQIEDIEKQQREFTYIIDSMAEGLILLDSRANILSINAAAKRLFGCQDRDVRGENILALNRSLPIQNAIKQPSPRSSAGETLLLHGCRYRIFSNPIHDDPHSGLALFIVNVDSEYAAERQRKEFSANVSHELKTPLTSISGYAEIMRNGLAAPEDTADFSNRIYEEANRLIVLIDDIIKLSRLDESAVDAQKEAVDLLELVGQAAKQLAPSAAKNQVSINILGDPLCVLGIRAVLGEMLYNLIDNAIKYSLPGGSVTVKLSKSASNIFLAVADTGIGIAKEHHEKVFERFYRVDKSHSKDTGGTGLGLAIVKHGALLHNAHITLDSAVGQGTKIELRFEDLCR